MMKKNKMKPIKLNSIFTALCIFVFICSACERTVEIDLEEHTPRLTVNSLFSPDSTIIVALSNSVGALSDSNINYIGGANVELYEGENLIEVLTEKVRNDTFVYDYENIPSDTTIYIIGTDTNTIVNYIQVPAGYDIVSTPYYESTIIPQPNVNYKLKAQKSGFADVEAEGNIPTTVPSASFDISGLILQEQSFGSEEDGYKYIEGNVKITVDDPAGEENFYEIKLFTYFEDSIFAYFGANEEDKIFLEVVPITSMVYYSSSEDLSAELGTEAEQSVFSDVLFDGESKVFRLNYLYGDLGRSSSANNKLVVEVIAVSKDYYRYKTSVESQSFSDGDPFSEPVFVYSNVENGYGIFAGFQSAKYEVDLDGL